MKTTENISLAGYAFTIETDAYADLESYLNDIREAFRTDPNAEEIVSDIEERIAELLREKCISGMVVNTDMIHDIRRRIGNPKDMVQDDVEADPSQEPDKNQEEPKKSWKSKRLFRNMDEKVLGGVCAGLGAYFGLDKVLFRIFFILFTVIPFIGDWEIAHIGLLPIPFLYCALWIAMPAARTDDQKREMKGKPTNLESYRNSDFDFKTEAKEAAHSPGAKAFIRIGGVFLGLLLLIAGFGGMIGGVVIPSIPNLVRHEVAEEIAEWGPLDEEEQLVADLLTNDTFWNFVIVIVGLMFVWFIYNGIMLIFDLKYPSWKPGLIIFIAWILSIFIFAGFVAKTAVDTIGTFIVCL